VTTAEIRAEIFELIKNAPLWKPPEDDGPPLDEPPGETVIHDPASDSLPRIMLGTDEHRCIADTIKALAADGDLYQRGRVLVRATQGERQDGVRRASGAATIEPLPAASLREKITRWCRLTRRNDKGVTIDAHPPGWLVSGVDARGDWPGIRSLVAVSETPILRIDGSLCQTPGWDESTGVLFLPTQQFPALPDNLEQEDAWRASESLLEAVCDFRFESDAHKSAWLAGLLTPLARHAFDGPSPLFLIDANIRGAGKGLLAQTIGRIVLGSEMPVSSYVHDGEEMRKQITSIAMSGDQMVLLDNISGPFGNASIDRMLTSTRWKDRILATNKNFDGPLLVTWYATGNNVQIDDKSDACRRIIHIRLQVMEERPELRSGFRHEDLAGWIAAERPRLLVDALAILSAYIRAGRPRSGLTPLGSFVGWSLLVREAVVWIGLPDPCLTQIALAEAADTTMDMLSEFLTAAVEWDWQGRGWYIGDLMRELYGEGADRGDRTSRMRAAIENLTGVPPGKTPTPRQIGNKLRAMKQRICGGLYVDAEEKTVDGRRWVVRKITQAAGQTDASPTPEPEPTPDDSFEWDIG
jgi:hypothetical protein